MTFSDINVTIPAMTFSRKFSFPLLRREIFKTRYSSFEFSTTSRKLWTSRTFDIRKLNLLWTHGLLNNLIDDQEKTYCLYIKVRLSFNFKPSETTSCCGESSSNCGKFFGHFATYQITAFFRNNLQHLQPQDRTFLRIPWPSSILTHLTLFVHF